MVKYLGCTSVIGMLVYGQAAPAQLPFAQWANLGAVGLMGLLLWYVVVKLQPKERREAREHTEKVVSDVTARFGAAQEQHHADQVTMAASVSRLAENCATHLQSCVKHLEQLRQPVSRKEG